MKRSVYLISVILLLMFSLSSADFSVDVQQDSSNVVLSFFAEDGGAYVEVLGCGDSSLMSDVILADTSYTFSVPACCSISVRWTPIIPDRTIDITTIGDNKVRIPGGWYPIGADDGDTGLLSALGAPPEFISQCTPSVWVFVDTFDIMTVEVPCSLYSQFIDVGGYSDSTYWRLYGNELSSSGDTLAGWNARITGGWTAPSVPCGDGAYPVRGVSYYEAVACAHWMGGQLPTEAQWEVAARLMNGDIFPWGNEFCVPEYTLTANISDPQQCDSDPFVGGPGYPEFFDGDISPSGCRAMGGNVSEWCLDVFSSSMYSTLSPLNPVSPGSETADKSIRGGNFASGDRRDATVFKREGFSPAMREGHIGFRVAWTIGNGEPDEWYIERYALDCESPETLGIWNPNGCLYPGRDDSFAVVFTEPVIGDVVINPDDPMNIVARYNSAGDTLWVVKGEFASIPSGTLCVDLSALTDTVGNSLGAVEICVPLCELSFIIEQHPETLWAPQECINQGEVWIINLSDYTIYVDSIMTYSPFELFGAVSEIDAGDTASLTVRFTPDCSGIISVPIVVFTSEGIFSDSLVGLGCDQPAVTFTPSMLDFGEDCDTAYIDVVLTMTGCSMGSLEICDISWSVGEMFGLDSIEVGDTIVDTLRGSARFNPSRRGEFYDTLSLRFRPLGGICCDATTILVSVSGVCKNLPCEPTTFCDPARTDTCDAFSESDVVFFGCVDEKVYIYDHNGRLVISIDADEDGEARWDFRDKNLNPVPAGIYYWRNGKHDGTIILIR